MLLSLAPWLLAAPSASLTVNTTAISAGDAVRVTWTGVDLAKLPPMHVKFSLDEPAHVHRWRVEPEGASSLWVGEFSPPVADIKSVHMGPNPLNRGIATEGTPPFTVPAPVKFISGTQLGNGHFDFVVSNMRESVNFVLFSGSLTDASDFQALAVSPTISIKEAASPMHLRLSR